MKTLHVAAVQTSPIFGEVSTNLHDAIGRIPPGCDLAVLPELFASGYQFRDRQEALQFAEDLSGDGGPVTRRLTGVAADSGTTIVAGLAEKQGDRLFNSSVLVRPDGSRETYRKVHLFMDEKSLFEPGDLGFPVFEACGTTVGMMICFDWIFPEAARSLALAGAERQKIVRTMGLFGDGEGGGDVGGDRSHLGIGHQPAGTENPAQLAELTHHVGRGDDDVDVGPPVLDLGQVLVRPDHVGSGVGRLFGPGLEQSEVGAGVRLGKAHRARPAAADQRFHENRLLFFRAVAVDGLHCTVGQSRVHRP